MKSALVRILGCIFYVAMITSCASQTPAVTPTPVIPPTATIIAETPVPSSTPAPTDVTLPPLPTFAPTMSPGEIQKNTRPLIMVHYMPWYQAPPVSASWGWHWTMNRFNPIPQTKDGRGEIASHYYPLTGPYDSGDDAILEYQMLLMKLSGIDGIIVDWYGTDGFQDYGFINRSTNKVFQYAKKAGLLFAICYEDRAIKIQRFNTDDGYKHAKQALTYAQEHWFQDESYLTSAGRPVLLVFGNPPYFQASDDWNTLFSGLKTKPILITEDEKVRPIGTSSYPWPPMSLSQNGVLSQETLNTYFSAFYKKTANDDYRVAGAFPGFHDIYKEAKVSDSYGFLDAQNGKTFDLTLQAALQSKPNVIQIATWNDYGEGTNIEPTIEYKYQYLEMIQNSKRSIQHDFKFTTTDLAIPLQILHLRMQYTDNPSANTHLDTAFAAIISGNTDAAQKIIALYNPPKP